MLLASLAIILLTSGIATQRFSLSKSAKRRVLLIAAGTALLVIVLNTVRLGPVGMLATLVGIGFGANQVMRELSRGGGFEDLTEEAPPLRPKTGAMDRDEALAVLGLEGMPDDEAITSAYKRMIRQAHPDQGGSDYLAAKVNEARQVLLPKR